MLQIYNFPLIQAKKKIDSLDKRESHYFVDRPNLFSVCQEFIVSLHFLFAGLWMPDDGDSSLKIKN